MAVISSVVLYFLPGLLGRAWDLKNNTVGPDLFRVDETNNARVVKIHQTTCDYKLCSLMTEAVDFMDVNGELSLKLKAGGGINLEGAGGYVKDTKTFENRVDLIVKLNYETVVKTLPSEIQPIEGWAELVKDTGMTHYIRSIKYGGQLIASVRMFCHNEEDKEKIKGSFTGGLGSDSGSFGLGLKASIEKSLENVKDAVNIDIDYRATIDLPKDISRDVEGLMRLVEQFPEMARQANDGLGVPIAMEVFSLGGLDKDVRPYWQTLAWQDQMQVMYEQFSDVQLAKQRLNDWVQTMPPNLQKEENDKIGEFATQLEETSRVFNKVINELDLSANATGEQFMPAFKAYQGDRQEAIPNQKVKDLAKLKKEVLDGTPLLPHRLRNAGLRVVGTLTTLTLDWMYKAIEADFGGPHYIRYGADSCPEDKSQLVYSGVLSTTDRSSIGSSESVCLPDTRQYTGDQADQDEIEDFPQVTQVAFVSRKGGAGKKMKTVKCASCRVPGKTTFAVLVAQTECPSGWTKQYGGLMISTDYQQVRGELICLDTSVPLEDVSANSEDLTLFTEVSPKCGSYPCSKGQSATKAVPCAVCSITKKPEPASSWIASSRGY